ncbi:hypothetical protein DESACE_02740 [Desulfurella acetivorans A63]|nr:hypothetical protein DESACE_02740 [Desulfurella acetivorans A63]
MYKFLKIIESKQKIKLIAQIAQIKLKFIYLFLSNIVLYDFQVMIKLTIN